MRHRLINNHANDNITAIVVELALDHNQKKSCFFVEYKNNGKSCEFLLNQENVQKLVVQLGIYLNVDLIKQLVLLLDDPEFKVELPPSKPPTSITYQTQIKRMIDNNTGEQIAAGIIAAGSKLDVNKINSAHDLELTQTALNTAIVKAAIEFSLLPNIRYRDKVITSDERLGKITTEFQRIAEYTFILKPETTPSKAIRSIYATESDQLLLDCTLAIQILFYKALLDICGELQFDQMFCSNFVLNLVFAKPNPLLNYSVVVNPGNLKPVLSPNIFLTSIDPGQRITIININTYLIKHPSGEAVCMNLIYLGRNQAGVHLFGGLFDNKKLHTYDEIMTRLATAYNSTPYPSLKYAF